MRRILPWAALLLAVGVAVGLGIRSADEDAREEAQESVDADQDLEPARPGCRIRGVVRRDGRPVAAGVAVAFVLAPEEQQDRWTARSVFTAPDLLTMAHRRARPVAEVRASDDGRFDVQGLRPATYAVIVSSADREAGGEETVRLTVEDEHAEVAIDVAPRTTLRGRVTHADGRSWSGSVVVTRRSGTGYAEDRLASDAWSVARDGGFRIPDLPPGTVHVCALDSERNQIVARRAVTLPTDREFSMTVEDGTFEVTGRVLARADGSPRAHATVVATVRWPTPTSTRFRAETDAQGRFRVRAPGRDAAIAVLAGRSAPVEAWVEGPGDDVEVLVSRYAVVRGRVTSASDGAPVPGVRVRATLATGALSRGTRKDEWDVLTDERGEYVIPGLPAGRYRVIARGGGWIDARLLAPEARTDFPEHVLAPDADLTLDLSVVPGARVVGSVRDARGRAVPGARIVVWPQIRAIFESVALPPSVFATQDQSVATDAAGGFEIGSLLPGAAYDLTAERIGSPDSDRRRAVAAASPRPTDLRMPPPRWLTVTVLDAESRRPVPRAEVTAFLRPEPGPEGDPWGEIFERERARAETDGDGRARLGPLGAGPVGVRVTAEGYPRMSEMQEADASGPGDLTTEVVLRRGRAVAGRVVLPDGTGADATLVTVTPEGQGSTRWATAVPVGRGGAFRVDDLAEGRYRVHAVRDRAGAQEGTASAAAGDESVLVRLANGPTPDRIVLLVRDPDGRPVPAAQASFHGAHGGPSVAVVNGRAALDLSRDRDPADRRGWVEVTEAHGHDGSPLPLGRVRRDGVRGGDALELRMPPERTIEGRVVGPDGRGVADARVRADPIRPASEDWPQRDEPWLWRLADAVRTDGDGRYRVWRLGEGRHRVFVAPPSGLVAPDPVVADAGARGVDFVARPGRSVTLTVHGVLGRPLEGARVIVAKEGAGLGDAWIPNLFSSLPPGPLSITDANGTVRLGGLDPEATYVVGVRAPAARSDLADRVERGWVPADATWRLARGHGVTGRVLGADDGPVEGASVSCEAADGVVRDAMTRRDGRFRFVGLPPGRVRVEARKSGHDPWEYQSDEQTVDAGTQDLVLVLVPTPR